MKKFVFVFYGSAKQEMSDEERQATMEKWKAWFGTFEDKIVDGGNPFNDGAKSVSSTGVEDISADMWPASGYTIINAADMDEATKIAEGCPGIEDDENGAVRVYEAMPM